MILQIMRRTRQKRISKLRAGWGKEKLEYFPFDKIEQYHRLVDHTDVPAVSAQTQSDIDFQDLFVYLDRTTSKVGQQFLYDQLLTPSGDLGKLRVFHEQVEYFRSHMPEREAVQTILSGLSKDGAYTIAGLFTGDIFEKPHWYNWVKIELAFTILLIVGSIGFHFLLIGLLIPLFINFVLHFWYKNRAFTITRTLPFLNILINTAKYLQAREYIRYGADVSENIRRLHPFQRKIRYLNTGSVTLVGGLEDLAYYVLDVIKGFFLIDFFLFFRSIDEVAASRADIGRLFHFVGWVDAAISVAYIRNGPIHTSAPTFHAGDKRMQYEALVHPLIADCVPNSLRVDARSVLITGSNMSGKTTFLRTIITNQLLAQTIYTTFSTRFDTSVRRIHSSIRIDDSLLDGKSYFFEEVRVMQDLIGMVGSDDNLFILDEVFKGTNTIERVSASKAILSYLNKGNNVVIVSTHDMELTSLLPAEYDLYHFSETIVDDRLVFDHLIKPGELATRNGIRLLEINGYPKEIIEESRAISQHLSHK